MVTTLLVATLLAGSPSGGKKSKGGGACPYMGIAQLDPKGKASEVTGEPLPGGGTVVAFDPEGKVGRMHVNGSGTDVHFADAIPERLKSMTLVRVLLVAKSAERMQVLEAGDDLPPKTNPESVAVLLGDDKGPKLGLITKANEDDASDTCDQLQAKVKGAWKVCWTNCKSDSGDAP